MAVYSNTINLYTSEMIVLDIIGTKTKYMSSVVNHAAAKSAAAILHFLGSACRHLSFLNVSCLCEYKLRSIFKINFYNFSTLSISKLVVTLTVKINMISEQIIVDLNFPFLHGKIFLNKHSYNILYE